MNIAELVLYIMFAPQVFLHELSHYVFILLSGHRRRFKFFWIGFVCDGTVDYNFYSWLCFLIGAISPVFTGVVYCYLLSEYYHSFNFYINIYLFIGILIFIPSVDDIRSITVGFVVSLRCPIGSIPSKTGANSIA